MDWLCEAAYHVELTDTWKGSKHQGYNACFKGHSEIKCQAEALGAILAGVDARRGRQEGTAEVDNERCTCCDQLKKQLQGQRSATINAA